MSGQESTSDTLDYIYANDQGEFYILQTCVGQNVPPDICGVPFLGRTNDLFIALSYHIKQSEIGSICEVGQQAVSRYVSDGSVPTLKRDQWLRFVESYYKHCRSLPEHRHTIEMYKQNVSSMRGRHKI